MWLSARLPGSIRSVVGFYGTQNIEFDTSVADYQLHFGDDDEVVAEDEVVETLSFLALAQRPVEVYRYPGARHCFVEPHAGTYDAAAAELAWSRAREFLAARLLREP
jgi:dienelactone hydrolase